MVHVAYKCKVCYIVEGCRGSSGMKIVRRGAVFLLSKRLS